MPKIKQLLVILPLMPIAYSAETMAAPPSPEEMWQIIQQQQRTIEELKAKLQATEEKVTATDEKVEAAAETAEDGAVSPTPSWADKTHLGGYGELHYNNLGNDGSGDVLVEVDFHRFVLYFGHDFNDRIRFFSELELEHSLSGDGEAGEVELEQAWLELDITDNHHLRAGLDLIPVGIINPTHEPPTFYGVERNPVETFVIPTTWWEAGIAVNGEVFPGWNYDVVLHSGLEVPTSGGSAFRIRDGRNKVSEASAEDGALTARLRYTGYPGLELGITGQYQQDITQSSFVEDISAWLVEAHADFRKGPFGLRALYARFELEEGPPGIGPAAFNADTLEGFYIEPSYRIILPAPIPGELGLFARYNRFDDRNQLTPLRFIEFEQVDVGFNYWPHPDVVFKFDYQLQDADGLARNEFDGFNLGLGYQF